MRNFLIYFFDSLMLCKYLTHYFIGMKFAAEIPINSHFCNCSQFSSIRYSILLDISCNMLDKVIEVSKTIKISEFGLILSEILLESKIRGCKILNHIDPHVVFTCAKLVIDAECSFSEVVLVWIWSG